MLITGFSKHQYRPTTLRLYDQQTTNLLIFALTTKRFFKSLTQGGFLYTGKLQSYALQYCF